MKAPRQPRRSSRRRLLVLLGIALVGYEVVIYRHWLESVPLLPARVVTLKPDQFAFRFVTPTHFAVVRRSQDLMGLSQAQGPVQIYEFPGDRVIERLTPRDGVCTSLPMQWRFPHDQREWRPLVPTNNVVAQHTSESAARNPIYYAVDDRRFLYLVDGSLHCLDAETNRTIWTRAEVDSVDYVKGNLACVTRTRIESRQLINGDERYPRGVVVLRGREPIHRSLLDLTDGHIMEAVNPGDYFSIVDVSPDRKWIAYRTNGGLEVWSLGEQKMAWRKPLDAAVTPDLRFSSDSQFLVWMAVDYSRKVRLWRVRSTDGRPADSTEDASTASFPIRSAATHVGSRFALLPKKPQKTSDLVSWLEMQSVRWGLNQSRGFPEVESYLLNLETGAQAGIVRLTNSPVHAEPNGDAFAVVRYTPGGPSLEFYAIPPQSNWSWLLLRALMPPLALVPIALVLHRRELAGAESQLLIADTSDGEH